MQPLLLFSYCSVILLRISCCEGYNTGKVDRVCTQSYNEILSFLLNDVYCYYYYYYCVFFSILLFSLKKPSASVKLRGYDEGSDGLFDGSTPTQDMNSSQEDKLLNFLYRDVLVIDFCIPFLTRQRAPITTGIVAVFMPHIHFPVSICRS